MLADHPEIIAILAPPPWAPSGYGVQCKLLATHLSERGYQVHVLAFAGCHERTRWWPDGGSAGMEIWPMGSKAYGNGLIAPMCQRIGAEALVIICDAWGVEPRQLGHAGCPVYPWLPIDTDPLGRFDLGWLAMARQACGEKLQPVAMSQFGQRVLADQIGVEVPWIPHSLQPEMVPSGNRYQWGRDQGLPDSAFLFSTVMVNDNKEARKAPDIILAAFAEHAKKHKDSWLYMHCEPDNPAGLPLTYAASTLGLQDRVRFPAAVDRGSDLLGAGWMAAMFARTDCYVGTSRAEGFGVPIIEALACGTPVIATRGSAMTELVRPEYGRLVSGQPKLAPHHGSWWTEPNIGELARAMDAMSGVAAGMRRAAALAAHSAASRWDADLNGAAWAELLSAPLAETGRELLPVVAGELGVEVDQRGSGPEGRGDQVADHDPVRPGEQGRQESR